MTLLNQNMYMQHVVADAFGEGGGGYLVYLLVFVYAR
jgi:hypothetical protein